VYGVLLKCSEGKNILRLDIFGTRMHGEYEDFLFAPLNLWRA